MKKLLFFIIIIIPFIGSCKKEISPTDIEVTPAQARDTLYFIMKHWYYWYDKMPTVDREDYGDPYYLLEAMRYKDLDRWSFVADYDEFLAEMEGSFVGHGIRVGLDDAGNARIALIYIRSPLYFYGVRRGWIIKKVNNTDLAPILISGDRNAYNNLMGPSNVGVINTFLFQKPDGTEMTVTSAKADFTINSVILYDTLQIKQEGTNDTILTGHLVLESFIEPTEYELANAFAWFKEQGIKELILDLRYNGGGYFYIAQILSSYIAGNGLSGSTLSTLQYNDKNQGENTTYEFFNTSYPVSLQRLIVITSHLTASASETLMNGLKPYINVVSVGDTTDGKPMGMKIWPCGNKYFFCPVTFKAVNSLNQGDFFDGLAPDKIASDDLAHDLNDRQEKCLNEAIRYIATGSFSKKGPEDFKRSVQISEKPSWMNNSFVRNK